MQSVTSMADPEQGAPDPDGAGLSQSLVLVLLPAPQDAEQDE